MPGAVENVVLKDDRAQLFITGNKVVKIEGIVIENEDDRLEIGKELSERGKEH